MVQKKTETKRKEDSEVHHVLKSKISKLHARNPHKDRYDLLTLSQRSSELKPYVLKTAQGDETIDFNNPSAVLALNKSLLSFYYNVKLWQIPENYLCPPIPGRADYIHYLADLLAGKNNKEIPRGKQIQVLDVGCGASCIYPILGSQSYGWKFVGSDIDPVSVACAKNIVQSNSVLKKHIKVVFQKNRDKFFEGIIKPDDYFDLTMCNPPFYESMLEAQENNQRKNNNLLMNQRKRKTGLTQTFSNVSEGRNFGGQNAELWCRGGEYQFVQLMAEESTLFKNQVTWFSSLLSKKENVEKIKKILKKIGANKVSVVSMSQGNKTSRFIAWSFLD